MAKAVEAAGDLCDSQAAIEEPNMKKRKQMQTSQS